jgi:hypothetical protein
MTPQKPTLRTDNHVSAVLPHDHVTKGLFFCSVSDDELTMSTKLLGVSGRLDLNLDWRLSEA